MRDFLKTVLASFVGLLLFSTLSLGGLIFLIAILAAGSQQAGPAVEDDSVLVFDLSLDITDANPSIDPGNLLGETLSGGDTAVPVSLRTVLDAIEAAAEDDRIVGILIQGQISPVSRGSGFATLKEVREALQTFQDSGKPIYAYETDWTEQDYYLASVADSVILNPTGAIELNGFSAETTFFAGAFEKYGVEVQVLRAGNFKSAVEPLVRANNSPESRQQTQELINDLWSEFLTRTAESRELTTQQIQQIANTRGFVIADAALEAGLVDQVAHDDEVLTQLRELTGEAEDESADRSTFRYIDLLSYADTADEADSSPNRVAIVYMEGEIVNGEGDSTTVGGDRYARLLRELRFDDEVKAIVLRVNSPGGGASPSEKIAHEVMLTSEVKPVIISMGSVAASGGYMIAAHGDRIFASPNTVTGSIGVFGLIANVKELANENGITWDVVKTAPFADVGTLARPLTPQELAIEQQIVDQIYDEFLTTVSEGRALPKDQVAQLAQGRVWSGAQAQQNGLVDELGGLESAIQAATTQAELGDDWQIEEYPQAKTLEQQIFESFFGVYLRDRLLKTTTTPENPIVTELQQFQEELEVLNAIDDPRRVYSILPFIPRID